MKNYFKILGVTRRSDAEAIKRQYRKLAWSAHPDRGGDAALFAEIGEAYSTFRNKHKHAKYLELLKVHTEMCGVCKGTGLKKIPRRGFTATLYGVCEKCGGAGHVV